MNVILTRHIAHAAVLRPQKGNAVADYISAHHGISFKDRVSGFKEVDTEFVLPDRKVYRSLSRAGVLLSSVCLEIKNFIQPYINENPYSVGMYCAVENGPVESQSAYSLKDTPSNEFAEKYRKARSPKLYLRQLPNLAAAQAGIFLNVMGPINVFNHSTLGSVHALEQADEDLRNGVVKAAVVCSASSLEDPLIVRRNTKIATTVAEGAAAVVFTNDSNPENMKMLRLDTELNEYFGIAQPLVSLAELMLSKSASNENEKGDVLRSAHV